MPGKRLLIVEVDRIVRDAVSRLFVYRGWEVERAASIADGLTKLVPAPDCLLMEVRCQDRPVADLIRQAQASGPPARVVVFTGFGQDELRERLDGQTVDAVIQKPACANELFHACEGVCA